MTESESSAFKQSAKSSIYSYIQLIGSVVTLLVFITGYTSLPALFGYEQPKQVLSTGVLSVFNTESKIALVLVSTPIFVVLGTWMILSITKLSFMFFRYLSIDLDDGLIPLIFGFLVILPATIGINLLFVLLLFGTPLSFYSILVGALCIVMIFMIYFFKIALQ